MTGGGAKYHPFTDGSWTYTGAPGMFTGRRALRPDLLSIRDLGEADGWRGHLVRGFFRLLRVVTGV